MKTLLGWQAISFMSRGLAMAIGIVQSVVIVRILSIGEYGLVTLAVSIGGAFGIYQHLGLASGSTREIASAKDDTEVFKIFITASFIRYMVTIPLAIFLYISSQYIAVVQYGNEALIFPLKIFAFVLLIQGVQSIFNSVISGTQRFKQLFVYQVVIALVGLFIYIPLIYYFKVDGYFMSLALFNLVGSLSLGVIALKPLKGSLIWPKKEDFKRLLKDILSISIGIYIVKIIFTYWQKSGPLLLGLEFTPEEIGVFGFALLYAGKLMMVSDSVTDVNLPVLSKKFSQNIDEFKSLFIENFNKVFVFIILSAATAIFWVKDIFHVLLGGDKYDAALVYIMPLVMAYVFYSVVNIVKSSILVPAKLVKEMVIGFSLMLFSTVGFYFLYRAELGGLTSMAYAMAVGSFVGLLLMVAYSWARFKFLIITYKHIILFLIGYLLSAQVIFEFGVAKVLTYLIGLFIYIFFVLALKVVSPTQIKGMFRGISGLWKVGKF